MTEPVSPWARPLPGADPPAAVPVPPVPRKRAASGPPLPRPPALPGARPGLVSGPVAGAAYPGPGGPPPGPPAGPRPGPRSGPRPGPAPTGPRSRRGPLLWYATAAGGVIVVGIVLALVLLLQGGGPFARAAAPPDTRPQLARLCPPPTTTPAARQPAPPTPPGPRTVDRDAGISYRRYPAPWQPWDTVWTGGTLRVSYRVGQHFVTEIYPGGVYHASILSASVPATTNDAFSMDLACTGRQVAADVRAEYYPQPNTMDALGARLTTLGGLPAWVTTFRLHFHEPGLRATDELVGLAVIDVGRPDAAILYVSIPGTHRQYDWVVDDVINSVRPV